MALSTSGTSSPAAIRPRSPPRLAVEGSSDVSFATWAKSAPPRIRASVVSARALAWSSAALPPTAGTLIRMCETLVRAGCSNWLLRAVYAAAMSASVTAGAGTLAAGRLAARTRRRSGWVNSSGCAL